MKSKELLLKHLTLNDCTGYVTSDGRLYKAIIDALDEAIDYAHSCTQLKEKEVLAFEDWLKTFKQVDGKLYQLDKYRTYCIAAMHNEYLKTFNISL